MTYNNYVIQEKKKRAEPSFSTFMDESDRDSVEISDYDYKKAKLVKITLV